MKIKKSIFLGFLSILLFVIAAIYITFPLIFHIGDRVTGYGDELVIAWIQNWVIHAFFTNPLSVFEANLFFPYHNSLAFSETFITTSILAIPIRLLTEEPITTVNFTLLSSLVLFGFSLYLLCFYLTKNFIISLFSGMLAIFSPAVLDYTVHLQVLSLECVPLAILFFLHFIKTQKLQHFAISLFFFVLQMYNSIMPGYFIIFSFVTIYLFSWFDQKKVVARLISRFNILLILIVLITLIPIADAYFSVSNQFHYVRDIRDAIHFAFQPEDFLYPGNRTRLDTLLVSTIPTNQYSQNNEFKPGYLGIIFTLLVIFSFWYVLKNFRKISLMIKTFLTIALLGFILSLGPFLHLARHTIHKPFPIPLPYFFLYYILPGFQGLRNSARWNMLFIIGIVVVISLVLNQFLSKFSFRKQLAIYILLFMGIVAELSPLTLYSIPQKRDFPKLYSWMVTTPHNATFIELPIYNWNMQPYVQQELLREYYGTIEFRRTVNGYTGFSPPPWQNFIYTTMRNFPDKTAIKSLKNMGITFIVVHKDEYDVLNKAHYKIDNTQIKNGSEIIEQLDKNKEVRLVKRFKNTYVYIL